MYPSRFRYEAPRSFDEAIGLLRDGGDYAKVLAGGQSLVPMMKLRFASPELLVDINNVPGLAYVTAAPDGSLHIGALTRHADLEWSQLLRDSQPTMAAAAPMIADPLVRNRGTLVGSLCHADPQGDWAAVMTAHDEIAVEAIVPPAAGNRAGGYLKLERRVGDFATCGVAVAIEVSGTGSIARAGIGLTGVGGATINAADAAALLVGKQLTHELIAEAADRAAAAAQPRSDHRGSAAYKRHMVRTFTARILSGSLPAETTEQAA
jgi:carbon-monoxide dehydrogenase medium subunit